MRPPPPAPPPGPPRWASKTLQPLRRHLVPLLRYRANRRLEHHTVMSVAAVDLRGHDRDP
uniref:Uncharacterized protein n=1 Tax=uncultured marine virus TaxID=186617 RepID=A0A0F7L5A7_9VIRU|nr:hypothetical protein [uncultured marine virus]